MVKFKKAVIFLIFSFLLSLFNQGLILGRSFRFPESFDFQIEQTPNRQKPSGTIDGHEYVDLGLPSGLKWATMNIGASSPEDYGNYFAWGEISTKEKFYWSTLKYCLDEHGNKFSKYGRGTGDEKTQLDSSDDAASAQWGSNWRIPTQSDWAELQTECEWVWTDQGGRNGYMVIGPNANSIFLPANGQRNGVEFDSVGSKGDYRSSSLANNFDEVYDLTFSSSRVRRDRLYRASGASVRPVSEGVVVASSSGSTIDQSLKRGQISTIKDDSGTYVGETKSGIPDGTGTYTWKNGEKYNGGWKNGKREGFGVVFLLDGSRYEGEWRKGEATGKGTYVRKIDRGVALPKEEAVIVGDFVDGSAAGICSITFPDKTKYEGEMKDGKQHGKGVFEAPDGFKCEGTWENGIQKGRGKLYFPNGDIYEGDLRSGVPEGFGKMTYNYGYVYEGNWGNGLANGRGKLFNAAGKEVFSGKWINGLDEDTYISREKLKKEIEGKKQVRNVTINTNNTVNLSNSSSRPAVSARPSQAAVFWGSALIVGGYVYLGFKLLDKLTASSGYVSSSSYGGFSSSYRSSSSSTSGRSLDNSSSASSDNDYDSSSSSSKSDEDYSCTVYIMHGYKGDKVLFVAGNVECQLQGGAGAWIKARADGDGKCVIKWKKGDGDYVKRLSFGSYLEPSNPLSMYADVLYIVENVKLENGGTYTVNARCSLD